MCTAISFQTDDHYFGRNLDLERSYGEAVTITPRNYPFHFRNGKELNRHYAMIGMAVASQSYPLYYEATNEKGLSIAGLNFPGIAVYQPVDYRRKNIAPFELIPYLLGQFETAQQAVRELEECSIWHEPFSPEYPLTPLHWMLSDKDSSFTLEPMADGLRIYQNPVGVLTNNPPFDYHMYNLSNYINLTRQPPENRFSDKIDLNVYSLGMGSIGLPGDLSSPSRFVKAAFTKLNSLCGDSEEESISQFFLILGAVYQQRGLVRVKDDDYEFTRYSSCCNTDKGIYYYRSYENSQISAVGLHNEDLNQKEIISYPLSCGQNILWQN